jgi:hypothetical protein
MTVQPLHDGSSTGRRFPNFLCIGAQKAGTTWLYDNLRRHPKIWLPPVKELHYFNHVHIEDDQRWTPDHRRRTGETALRRYLERSGGTSPDAAHVARLNDIISGIPNDDWYARIFEPAGADQLCGDVTPRYAAIPLEGVDHVRRLMPGARILFILRDPIDRCWSQIRMLMGQRSIGATALAAIEKIALSPGVLTRSDYCTTLDTWAAFESEGKFLTLFFDDIAEDPAAVLRDVCDFLAIEHRETLFHGMRKQIHSGQDIAMPPEIYSLLKDQLDPVYRELVRRFPERGKKWASLHYCG